MMGYSHALTGVIAGCGVIAVLPAPIPVKVLTVALVGGGALLPDIDHPGATVARSMGPITGLISRAVNALALTIYHATRTPLDPSERTGGHRLITHVPVGAAAFGVIAAIGCAVSPLGAAIVCGLVIGLLAGATRRLSRKLVKVLTGFRQGSGMIIGGVSGALAYWVSGEYPGWWWLYGAAVALGCQIHREGDWCTNAGTPRRLWPMVKNGRRWDKDTCPIGTFDTGKETEILVVQRLLLAATALSIAAVTGTLAVAWDLTAAVIAGGTR